jgi:hypothetical protein
MTDRLQNSKIIEKIRDILAIEGAISGRIIVSVSILMTRQIEQLSSLAKPSKCWAIASAIVVSEKQRLFLLTDIVFQLLYYL